MKITISGIFPRKPELKPKLTLEFERQFRNSSGSRNPNIDVINEEFRSERRNS